jgi:hypothetical protein
MTTSDRADIICDLLKSGGANDEIITSLGYCKNILWSVENDQVTKEASLYYKPETGEFRLIAGDKIQVLDRFRSGHNSRRHLNPAGSISKKLTLIEKKGYDPVTNRSTIVVLKLAPRRDRIIKNYIIGGEIIAEMRPMINVRIRVFRGSKVLRKSDFVIFGRDADSKIGPIENEKCCQIQ